MAINKKLITFASKSTFTGANGINGKTSPTNGCYGNIPSTSIVFILDTGEIWTHGKYISGGVWGTKQTGYVPLTISNTTYNLSTSDHNHTLDNLNGTLSISKGGTGANTAAGARSNLGAAAADHSHAITLSTDSGTSSITLNHNTKYKLTVGGQSIIFTMPSDNNTTYNFSGTTFYSGNSNTAEHDANIAVKNGHYYYQSNGPATSIGASTDDGALYVQSYSDSWVGQIAQDYRNGRLFFRGKNNGTWQPWLTNIDSGNYTNYAATKDHTHSQYLPLSAGSSNTLTGYLYLGNDVNSTSQALIFCGSVGPTTGSYFHYNPSQGGGLFINGYKYLTLETSSASYHPRVRLGGSDYPLLSTYNWSSYITALKNPNALTVFGVSYDGSATKTVDKTTFIGTLEEGTDNVTDGTMFVTSFASDNGFAYTDAVNTPYKRKASCLYNYIKGKTDSLYSASGHTHTFASLTNKPTTLAGYGITDAASSSHNHDGRYLRWNGSAADVNAMSWGTLTAANGYTILSHTSSSDGGDMGFCNKNGQIFMQIDGFFYQNEGTYQVLDTNSHSTSSHKITIAGKEYSTLGGSITAATIGSALTSSAPAAYASNSDKLDGYDASSFLKLSGGTMSGAVYSTFTSNSWINGVSNAVINLNNSGYGAAISMPVNSGRVSISTYAASTNNVYFGYASSTQIANGTNSFTTQMYWDAPNNILYANTFSGALSGNASSATKLTTDAGGSTTPVYFSGGKPVACTAYSSASVNYANSAGNADTVDGLHVHTGRNSEANKIVRTDDSGYIQCGYINSSKGNEGNNANPARVWGTNGSDDYLRTYLTSALNVNYASGAGYATYAGKLYINDANSQSVWRWYGQSGQPSWLWGSNDGTNMYVWNPSNFSVNYANSAGSATSATSATNATYATYVKDYNSTSGATIQIGYAGTGLTSSTITHVAGYTDNGTKIKDISKSELYNWLGITDTTYSAATSSVLGLIKIGYSTSGQNYPVQLDSNNKAYVYVPWTNTDTNTWRGIQNNLTSTSTTDSLSAYQGYLLANGNARDNTKLSTSGGKVTGNVQIVVNTSTSALQVYGGSNSIPSLEVYSGDTTNGGYASVSICSKSDGSCWWSIGSTSSFNSGALLFGWKGSSTARAQIQTDGSVKATTFYNSSGTEVSYSGHTHSGIPSGTVGSVTQGVYLNSGSITKMTYGLNADVNSGTSSALAYYSGSNKISCYTSTTGTSMKPIYLYQGQPTQCSGYMINNFAVYKLTFGSSSVTSTKQTGSYNFISSVTKESNSGRYIMTCSFPTGYTKYTTMIFGNVSVYNPSNYNTPGHLTIQKEYGTTNGIRLILADDDTPNGYTNSIAYINFITF